MKPLRKRLEQQVKLTGLHLDTIQQDYVLTWLLDGIAKDEYLGKNLVFKGGTALKKCYFGRYRFSEDLDFTAVESIPKELSLEEAIINVCSEIQTKMNEYAPIILSCMRYIEKRPHPNSQEAYVIKTQFPWQREPLTKVMIEITREERIVLSPEYLPILHDYDEPLDARILSYSMKEIVIEKLRAILQHTKKLHERHWSRSRARDYYDLWHILCQGELLLSSEDLFYLLKQKCSGKEVDFSSVEDFFLPVMIDNVKQTWDHWLGPLVQNLPNLDAVLEELKFVLQKIFDSSFQRTT